VRVAAQPAQVATPGGGDRVPDDEVVPDDAVECPEPEDLSGAEGDYYGTVDVILLFSGWFLVDGRAVAAIRDVAPGLVVRPGLLDELAERGVVERIAANVFPELDTLDPELDTLDPLLWAALEGVEQRGGSAYVDQSGSGRIGNLVVVNPEGTVTFEPGCNGERAAAWWDAQFAELADLARRHGGFDPRATDLDVFVELIVRRDEDLVNRLYETKDELDREAMAPPAWDEVSAQERSLEFVEFPPEFESRIGVLPMLLRLPESFVDPESPVILCARLDVGWSSCANTATTDGGSAWHVYLDGTSSPFELWLVPTAESSPSEAQLLVSVRDVSAELVQPSSERNTWPIVTLDLDFDGSAAEALAALAAGRTIDVDYRIDFVE
jgi:hypothetical protein